MAGLSSSLVNKRLRVPESGGVCLKSGAQRPQNTRWLLSYRRRLVPKDVPLESPLQKGAQTRRKDPREAQHRHVLQNINGDVPCHMLHRDSSRLQKSDLKSQRLKKSLQNIKSTGFMRSDTRTTQQSLNKGKRMHMILSPIKDTKDH